MDLPPPIVIALDAAEDPLSGYHAWTSYVTPAAKWGGVPVTIGFAEEPPPTFATALDLAARMWSTPACSGARFMIGPSSNQIILHRTDWPAPLSTGAAGHTVIVTMGDKIVEADIHLNLRDFTFTVGAEPPKIDLQAILTHELGHVLGIGHSEIPRATMNAGLLSGIGARSLEKDDVDAVCAMYPGAGAPCGACPAGYRCVGFSCEKPDEPAVNGGPCASASEVRRCEGAGDVARCIATSIGERCARPCPPECGAGLACVAIAAGDSVCVPIGAGVDAGLDAASDAAIPVAPAPTDGGCACTHARTRGDGAIMVLLLLLGHATLRRAGRA